MAMIPLKIPIIKKSEKFPLLAIPASLESIYPVI
jgi:hypothetical protein